MRLRRTFNHIQCGWHEIGGRRIYFRSKLEVDYAKKLQVYQEMGAIKNWEYEPKVFYFEGIKRGTTNYTPDFKVYNTDGSHHWVECKGYWDAKSLVKVKRFRKFYPNEKLICVNQRG